MRVLESIQSGSLATQQKAYRHHSSNPGDQFSHAVRILWGLCCLPPDFEGGQCPCLPVSMSTLLHPTAWWLSSDYSGLCVLGRYQNNKGQLTYNLRHVLVCFSYVSLFSVNILNERSLFFELACYYSNYERYKNQQCVVQSENVLWVLSKRIVLGLSLARKCKATCSLQINCPEILRNAYA